MKEAQDAGGDDRDGDDSSDEEAERVQRGIAEGRLEVDDDFVRQPRMFTSLKDAVDSAPSQDDLVAADEFVEGDLHAPKSSRKNLLNKHVGLTDLNCGRSCYLA